MKIHHIGYLVQDKAATMRAFEALGYHKNENSGGVDS